MSIVDEGIEHLRREIAPNLVPNLEGLFQVRLYGLHRYHADIGIFLVNEKGEILKGFGRQTVKVGNAVVVDQFSSVWNEPGTPAVEANYQVWPVGINAVHTECELSIRLVDNDRNEVKNFGSMTKKPGEALTLHGMNIKVNVIPKRLLP